MSDVDVDIDMSNENANSANPTTTTDSQQYLLDIIAQLEHRLQNALTSIDSYQIERYELLDRIIQLELRLQNVVNVREK